MHYVGNLVGVSGLISDDVNIVSDDILIFCLSVDI